MKQKQESCLYIGEKGEIVELMENPTNSTLGAAEHLPRWHRTAAKHDISAQIRVMLSKYELLSDANEYARKPRRETAMST